MVKFRGDLGFLSNFSPHPVDGCQTLEHAFQAAKTNDEDWKDKIFNAPTPTEAKRLGLKCPLRPNWESLKVQVMLNLLIGKFSNPELKKRLKKVDDKDLVEMNEWHDNYWGICTCNNCFMDGKEGKNILGLLLQIVKRM
jgi:ribA/ribD-fused uncharacterized protein